MRRVVLAILASVVVSLCFSTVGKTDERAFGRVWGGSFSNHDWNRFYHYPYVFYPHNYWGSEYFRSSENLYYRYPPEMRQPVYNNQWHNFFPAGHRYHSGKHFMLDVF